MDPRHTLTRSLLPLLAFTCVAQQASNVPAGPPTQQAPIATFQSTTRLVTLDVVVTDKQGKPVRNLSKDDFVVVEDGVQQNVASFEPPDRHGTPLIEETSEAAAGATAGKNSSQPSTLTSSALTILVVDELDTQVVDQAFARAEVRKYLLKHGPHLPEPTALMALEEKRLELLHDYSSDANVLLDALHRHRPELPFRLMTGEGIVGASERLASALEALREIGAANSHFAGRKNVIWIGPGFPALDYLRAQPTDKARLLGYVQETSELMWQGRLSVYTLDPRGLQVVEENFGEGVGSFFAPPSTTTSDLVFEQVAPQTGGRMFRNLNDLDAQIAQSVADGDSYYAMSYYPTNHVWNGGFRKIRVIATNAELTARTRNGYYSVPNTTPTFHDLDRLLSRAVINPLPYHSLTVTAHGSITGGVTKVAATGASVRTAHVTIRIDASELYWQAEQQQKHRCEVTVVAVGFSEKGRVIAQKVKELEVVVDDNKYAELRGHGMVMNLPIPVSVEVVRMRVVARDSTNGNLGTADLTPEGVQFH